MQHKNTTQYTTDSQIPQKVNLVSVKINEYTKVLPNEKI